MHRQTRLSLQWVSWATHVGYELVDAYLNRNYSMSYMFSYGPFFHTGIKADFAIRQQIKPDAGRGEPNRSENCQRYAQNADRPVCHRYPG